MLGRRMPNSGSGECPGTRVMTIFVSHVATQRANPYWWNFPNLAVWPSPELIFVPLYWISHEKSNDGYTSCGGWTFCKFVDFRLFLSSWVLEFFKVGKVGMFRKVGKVYRPWEVSHLFSREISCRMQSESCLGSPWARFMSISIKTYIFVKVREGKGKEGKGRERQNRQGDHNKTVVSTKC